MEKMYKPTVKLTKEEKRQLIELKHHYQGKNLDEKMTIQKAIAMLIADAHAKVFGKKQTKKGVSSPEKGDDMTEKISELFVKSDSYIPSQEILQHLGLPSSDGRKLALAMKKLKIGDRRTKTGKSYAVKRKK